MPQMTSDDVARITREMEWRLDNLINFLKLRAETDPLWERKVKETIAIIEMDRELIAGADSGILPSPWPYTGGPKPPNHWQPRVVADAATDSPTDEGNVDPLVRDMAEELKGDDDRDFERVGDSWGGMDREAVEGFLHAMEREADHDRMAEERESRGEGSPMDSDGELYASGADDWAPFRGPTPDVRAGRGGAA
jgi:hypothetical protein